MSAETETASAGAPAASAPAASWHDLAAPGLAAFEALAEGALVRLPEGFRKLCADVVIVIEDFPTDEVLDALGAETPFDLLGLFQGVGQAQGGALAQTGQMPNMVFLYRRPILDYWAEHEETLGDIVTHVLVHEIGHHFGLSDDDMEAVEADAD
ncbi:metallopeptidase family protein [Xanthobacter agilis]|uniref:Zn-dependent protease with MMP-like domain n=1 Tax=Xanthobacter agilis TaxID=47492 RepID=A0ABU0LG32_XANAG|nr:metallopeptidase family protein [Xanthobacter agilis]MDQ0506088.1 putative Zn-dependent protease with MMP-like domain [Xanthobacter agilis]